MRKSVILLTLMCLAIIGFADEQTKPTLVAGSGQETLYPIEVLPTAGMKKDCTVKLDMDLKGGGHIQGEITFEDVSWWDCTKIKVTAWFARTF